MRHHESLIRAAIELLEERGGARFSVTELAERAEVSRRTVFNHFESLDAVLAQAGSTVLAEVLDNQLREATRDRAAGPDESMVEDLARYLAQADLVPPLARLARMLGGSSPEEPWRVALMH